jgi:hypothetical protein
VGKKLETTLNIMLQPGIGTQQVIKKETLWKGRRVW